MIEIKSVEDIHESRLYPWNQLLDKSVNVLAFQRYEWVECWWKTFATRQMKLWILLARKDNELIGIAPLMYKKRKWPGFKIFEFIGNGYFDYFDFIIKKGEEADVINSFINSLAKTFGKFALELSSIFEESPTFKMLSEKVHSKDFNGIFFPGDFVPFIQLPEEKDRLSIQIKKSLKTDLNRQERHLEGVGSFEFRQCQSIGEALNVLEDFFSMHIKKWESSNGYSVYKFKSRRDFLRELVKSLFDKKIVNLYFLSMNINKKLSICFTFVTNGRLLYYAPSYEPDFAKYSPGKILIARLIDYAITQRYKEFDFGIGSEPYKLQWTDNQKKLYHLYLFADSKNLIFKISVRLYRYAVYNYRINILPCLRKFHLGIYIWRRLNRKRSRYKRFQ